MRMVTGTFNGTGAAVYLCVGFIPSKVRIWDMETATNSYSLDWSDAMRSAEMVAGIEDKVVIADFTGVRDYRTASDGGVVPYEGGDLLTSSNQTTSSYGEGVYLGWDNADYRQSSSYGYTDAPIDTWTLGSSSNRTGNFNDDVPSSGSRIGEGSRILIEENAGLRKWAVIEAVTAGQGEAANEVTLSRSISSGKVRFISGMYSLAPIAVGKTTPAGIYMADTNVSVDNAMTGFEMWLAD